MTTNRLYSWRSIALLALLSAAFSANAAPPIQVTVLYGGNPTPKLIDPIRNAINVQAPGLAERLVFTLESSGFNASLLDAMAARVLAQRPDVVVALDLSSAHALLKARGVGSTPILFRVHADPLASGLIANYAKPGRRLSGVATYRCIDDKLVEMLLDAFPAARRIGFFVEPDTQDYGCHKRALDFAAERAIALVDVRVKNANDLPAVLASLGKSKLDAMVVPALPSTWGQRQPIVAAMDALALPAIYETTYAAQTGGLMHFSALDQEDTYARLAQLIVKVVAGEDAGNIPVSQPTRFELVVNLKAAHALRYRISPKVLRRADRIIE